MANGGTRVPWSWYQGCLQLSHIFLPIKLARGAPKYLHYKDMVPGTKMIGKHWNKFYCILFVWQLMCHSQNVSVWRRLFHSSINRDRRILITTNISKIHFIESVHKNVFTFLKRLNFHCLNAFDSWQVLIQLNCFRLWRLHILQNL